MRPSKITPAVARTLGTALAVLAALAGPGASTPVTAAPDGLDESVGAKAPGPPAVQGALRPEQNQPTEAYSLVDTWTSRPPNAGVPEFERPAGLDVAADDTIYVADSRAGTIYHLSDRGQRLGSWSPGAGVGPPLDVAVGPDRVYVIGGPGSDGEIRDLAGNLIATMDLDRPAGIAVGADRRVYVSREASIGGNTVAAIDVLDTDGNRLETWSGEPLLRIRDPWGIDVADDGTVYLAADGAVYVFRGGSVVGLLRVRSGIEGPNITDVAVEGNTVYATLRDRVAAWSGGARATPPDAPVTGAQNLAVGPRGGLAVSSYTSSDFVGISYITDRGDLGSAIQFWGRADDTLGELAGPSRVAAAANGDVFILDELQRAQQWSSAGEPLTQWTPILATDVAGGAPTGCTIDGRSVRCLGPAGSTLWQTAPAGAGWLSAADGSPTRLAAVDLAQQVLWVLDTAGTVLGSQGFGGAGNFLTMGDVAVDGSDVYLTNRAAKTVLHRTIDGAAIGSFPVDRGPVRVAAADGSVFVSTLDGWVWKYTPDGTVRTVFQPAVDNVADIAAAAGGRVYVASPGGDSILVYAPDPASPPPPLPPPPPQTDCAVRVDKRAAPARVNQGESATVTLEVTGACPFGDEDLDIVMVIDRSGSMVEPKLTSAKSAAIAFLAELNPQKAQVGIVSFSSTAEVAQPLTGDLRSVVTAIADLTIGGQTFYEEALDLARAEIGGPNSRPSAGRVVVMLTDGQPTDQLRGAAAAERLKADGVTLYVIGLGPEIDADLLRTMASTPDLYFEAPTEAELAGIYTAIARRIGATKLLRTATVTDELPADMNLVPGSPSPAPDIAGRTLTWRLSDVPASGTSLTYDVVPTLPGPRPTNVEAVLDYVDALGTAGRATFPVPMVDMIPKTRWDIFFPAVLKAQCRPKRADVVLVLDSSSSMMEPARPGTTKLDEAVRSARTFLDAMQLPDDRAAIVTFDSGARVAQGLTGSRPALEFALAGITAGRGTRIDLGLDAGLREVLGPNHLAANTPVMIVLTDGRPAGGSEAATQANADLAQRLGVELFMIGLGADADQLLLLLLAGDTRHFYFAPTTDALAGIYGSIAGDVLCK